MCFEHNISGLHHINFFSLKPLQTHGKKGWRGPGGAEQDPSNILSSKLPHRNQLLHRFHSSLTGVVAEKDLKDLWRVGATEPRCVSCATDHHYLSFYLIRGKQRWARSGGLKGYPTCYSMGKCPSSTSNIHTLINLPTLSWCLLRLALSLLN